MPTNNAPTSPEYSRSPEDQAIDIRLRIIAGADLVFDQIAAQYDADVAALAPQQRKLPSVNPLFGTVMQQMNQPALGQKAKDIIDEIYGPK